MPKYTVSEAETMFHENASAVRKEYSRMRDIAQKRIQRLRESEFTSSRALREHSEGFAKLKDIDARDLPKAFSELSKFIGAKGSSVTGQRQIREKTIRTWQEQGLNLNRQNYDKAIKILEEMRRRKIVYGSDKVIELADTMLEMDDQQTNEWLDHLDYLLQHTEELQEIPELRGYDFDEIRDMIGD